ncbi:MAG: Holliday junction branch migration protein RuvA [Methanospirillum sp.]|nr:Holliday junction branch migration protein RuvA [Methanospirillum sp.]
MFAYLEGTVDGVDERSAVIDVGGVGFRVFVHAATARTLSRAGGRVRLHTHLAIREDALSLYGFLDPRDLEAFRALIGVTKVGPALAIKILSEVTVDDLILAVRDGDEEVLIRVPGIGTKSAKRLILELRDRFREIGAGSGVQPPISGPDPASDAMAALVALGFSSRAAGDAVEAALVDHPGADLQGLIRGALARLRRD